MRIDDHFADVRKMVDTDIRAGSATRAKSPGIPAVNNHGGFGRWAFLEVTDPWDAANLIRASLGANEGVGAST